VISLPLLYVSLAEKPVKTQEGPATLGSGVVARFANGCGDAMSNAKPQGRRTFLDPPLRGHHVTVQPPTGLLRAACLIHGGGEHLSFSVPVGGPHGGPEGPRFLRYHNFL